MPQGMKAQQLADSLDAVLARLPMDADTYRIRQHVAEVRSFTNNLRRIAKRKSHTQGGIDASPVPQER
jgi:hypothetical protein